MLIANCLHNLGQRYAEISVCLPAMRWMIVLLVTHFRRLKCPVTKPLVGAVLLAEICSGCRHDIPPASVTQIHTGTTQTLRHIVHTHNAAIFVGGGDTTAALFQYQSDSLQSMFIPCPTPLWSAASTSSTLLWGNSEGQCIATDNAFSWRVHRIQQPWETVRSLAAANDSAWLAIVGNNTWGDGYILRSTDNGETWQTVLNTGGTLRGIRCWGDTCVACGYGAIYRSLNGGTSWEITTARGDLFVGIDQTPAHTWWAIGKNGSLISSQNRGNTWRTIRNGNFRGGEWNAITTAGDNILIAGAAGKLLLSRNGGTSWTEIQTAHKKNLYGAAFIAPNTALVCGEAGICYRIQL